MQLVAPAFGDNCDGATAGATVLRVVRIRKYAKFLNRIHGWNMDDLTAGLHVAYAVEQHFVFGTTAAIYGEACCSADVKASEISPGAAFENSRGGPCQLKRISALCRQIVDEFV